MIQKRYQLRTKNGIEWSSWYNYNSDDSLLQVFKETEPWQVKNKLKNQFRIV